MTAPWWSIVVGDVSDSLRAMAPESVHCVVTSPPYWGLRQYLFDKATVVRDDLSHDEGAWLDKELSRRGIVPRRADGSIHGGVALAPARDLP